MIHLTPDSIAALIAHYLQPRETFTSTGRKFGLSPKGVKHILSSNGVRLKTLSEIRAPVISSETKDLVVRRYRDEKHHQTQIAKETGLRTSIIRAILVERGIPRRTITEYSRTYTDTDSYFSIIDSHEKAHILGFLCADGYIGEDRGRVSLKVSTKDFTYLKAVRDRLAPQRPLPRRWRAGPFGRFESAELEINSRPMVADLVRLGLHQRKSLTLDWPKELPDEFIPSFLLGYFDGDGGISQDPRGCRIIMFVGTPAFLGHIVDILGARFGIRPTVQTVKNNAIHKIQITGNWQIMKILDWMYSGSKLYLHRKWERYNALKQEYKGRIYYQRKAA